LSLSSRLFAGGDHGREVRAIDSLSGEVLEQLAKISAFGRHRTVLVSIASDANRAVARAPRRVSLDRGKLVDAADSPGIRPACARPWRK